MIRQLIAAHKKHHYNRRTIHYMAKSCRNPEYHARMSFFNIPDLVPSLLCNLIGSFPLDFVVWLWGSTEVRHWSQVRRLGARLVVPLHPKGAQWGWGQGPVQGTWLLLLQPWCAYSFGVTVCWRPTYGCDDHLSIHFGYTSASSY